VRAELIAAAERLLAERGTPDQITVAEIVRDVGVTAPVLYAHFADKDALFRAIHERRMHAFQHALRTAGRKAPSPLAALEQRGRAYVRFAVKNPDAYRALFMSRLTDDDHLHGTSPADLTAFDDLVLNIQACIDAGEIPPGNPQLLARVVWAQVHGLAAMLIAVPEVTQDVSRSAIIDATIHAVTASLLSPRDQVQSEDLRRAAVGTPHDSARVASPTFWRAPETTVMHDDDAPVPLMFRHVQNDYRHRPKQSVAVPPLIDEAVYLKWYSLAAPGQLHTGDELAEARLFIRDEIRHGRLALTNEIGFVVQHRVATGADFFYVCSWNGNNELWETHYYRPLNTGAYEVGVHGTKFPTFCVWVLAIVHHETGAWSRYLTSERDAAARRAYCVDQLNAIVQ
jgi:AcrR family transcriptional regulator